MTPQPTGRIAGNELILTRSFQAPIADVWTSVTKSESTARWFGRWEGEAAPGKTVRLLMVFEKGDAWTNVLIEKCEPPHHLVVMTKSDFGEKRLELRLAQAGDTTELTFVHHLADKRKMAGELGPGWEYYFDMLVAVRAGQPLPTWEDYYPAQKQHYLDQLDQP
ncbi:MAG: SRPBCC family protein [Kofleriaceae bacterium]